MNCDSSLISTSEIKQAKTNMVSLILRLYFNSNGRTLHQKWHFQNKDSVCVTWQCRNEVPLEHGFEVGVYVAVL